jgi:hypothetical protein
VKLRQLALLIIRENAPACTLNYKFNEFCYNMN